MPRPERYRPRPIVALTLLFAMMLLWPLVLNGGPLLFFDSLTYRDQGEAAVEGLISLLPDFMDSVPAGETVATPGFTASSASATFVRSIVWAAFAYVGSLTPLGLAGPAVLQSLVVAGLVMLLLVGAAGARLPLLALPLALLAGLTSLPWFASYLMPDILAAVPVLAGLILVQEGPEGMAGAARGTFVGLAALFAILSHYGYLPLAIAVAGAVLLVLALRRRLSVALVLLALAPLLLAVSVNMVASKAAFNEAEVAPKRLPILLARSIEDGPARWYLAEACPAAGYALCPYVADLPSTAGGVLWGRDSLLKRAGPEEIQTIRAEEMTILWRSFRAYPLQQAWSFTSNGVRQLLAIGMDDFRWGGAKVGADGVLEADVAAMTDRRGLDAIGRVQAAGVLASLLAILAFAFQDRLTARKDERALLFVLVTGLVANAFIFGGLSAPVDRYQGRLVWMVPLLALLFAINRFKARQG